MKLLVVQPLDEGLKPDGRPQVAPDATAQALAGRSPTGMSAGGDRVSVLQAPAPGVYQRHRPEATARAETAGPSRTISTGSSPTGPRGTRRTTTPPFPAWTTALTFGDRAPWFVIHPGRIYSTAVWCFGECDAHGASIEQASYAQATIVARMPFLVIAQTKN